MTSSGSRSDTRSRKSDWFEVVAPGPIFQTGRRVAEQISGASSLFTLAFTYFYKRCNQDVCSTHQFAVAGMKVSAKALINATKEHPFLYSKQHPDLNKCP